MMNWLSITALAAGLATPSEPQQVHGAPEVLLEIQSPQPDSTLSKGFTVNLNLTGPAKREFEVELACFGTTHYLLAAGHTPGRSVDEQGGAKWNLWDRWILPEAGPATLTVRVRDLGQVGIGGESRLIEEREIAFRYEPLSGEALTEELATQTSSIAFAWMRACELIEPRQEPYGYDPNNAEYLLDLAETCVEARHTWLRARVTAYALLAESYESALMPGDALRALRYAQELYDAESTEVISHPPLPPTPILWRPTHWTNSPLHLYKLADFYARRNDLDRATYFAEQMIAYYRDQVQRHPKLDAWHRDRCHEQAAWTMVDVARWHYLVRRDREGYDRWMAKFAATKPKPAGNRGLLGQD